MLEVKLQRDPNVKSIESWCASLRMSKAPERLPEERNWVQILQKLPGIKNEQACLSLVAYLAPVNEPVETSIQAIDRRKQAGEALISLGVRAAETIPILDFAFRNNLIFDSEQVASIVHAAGKSDDYKELLGELLVANPGSLTVMKVIVEVDPEDKIILPGIEEHINERQGENYIGACLALLCYEGRETAALTKFIMSDESFPPEVESLLADVLSGWVEKKIDSTVGTDEFSELCAKCEKLNAVIEDCEADPSITITFEARDNLDVVVFALYKLWNRENKVSSAALVALSRLGIHTTCMKYSMQEYASFYDGVVQENAIKAVNIVGDPQLTDEVIRGLMIQLWWNDPELNASLAKALSNLRATPGTVAQFLALTYHEHSPLCLAAIRVLSKEQELPKVVRSRFEDLISQGTDMWVRLEACCAIICDRNVPNEMTALAKELLLLSYQRETQKRDITLLLQRYGLTVSDLA